MTIRLSEQDFRRLVDILSRNPNFHTPQDRLDFMRAAFFGSPREHDVLGNLDLSGTPNSAAIRVIIHLSEFGQDKPGRETLGVLVDRLLQTMGGGKDEDSLNDLKRRYPFEAGNAEPMPPEVKGDGSVPPPDSKPLNTGNAWAVLVGVNTYEDKENYGELRLCANDAEAVREQLIAGGYNPERIRLLTDRTTDLLPTRNNILKTLKAVAEATEPDDLLLFYYSGHGDEADDASYLVARDGQSMVLGDTAVAVSRVKHFMEEAPARAKVVLLDACHSGANIGMKGPGPCRRHSSGECSSKPGVWLSWPPAHRGR